MALSQFDEARTAFLEALGILIHLYGERHTSTVGVYYNLSRLAASTQNFLEAKEMCECALEAQHAMTGARNDMSTELLGHLAEIYRSSHLFVQAKVSSSSAHDPVYVHGLTHRPHRCIMSNYLDDFVDKHQ